MLDTAVPEAQVFTDISVETLYVNLSSSEWIDFQESLVAENEPDFMANEQTWPTEEELDGRWRVLLQIFAL